MRGPSGYRCRMYVSDARVQVQPRQVASPIITLEVVVHVICLVYIQLGGINGVNFILLM